MAIQCVVTAVEALYSELFERGIAYFLPHCETELVRESDGSAPELQVTGLTKSLLEVRWLGTRYMVHSPIQPFTVDQWRMITSISTVLASRLRVLIQQGVTPAAFNLFGGIDEDRYVSAFLDPTTYKLAPDRTRDRFGDALEVLRSAAATVYEGGRVSTGALMLGREHDGYHHLPAAPPEAVRYAPPLTAVRSFYHLCDGQNTIAVVDLEGRLAEISDIWEWCAPLQSVELPVPSAKVYEPHARATLAGGHICLLLTANNAIRVLMNGVRVLQYSDGRWYLTDIMQKYKRWRAAVANEPLAKWLFQAALNVAEHRCGSVFVVLDDPGVARALVAPGCLLEDQPLPHASEEVTKEHLHYLLRNKSALDMPTNVLESIACIDGSVILDRTGRILAFGAIIRNLSTGTPIPPAEGGRTVAAMGASRFGKVLKISEDGPITFFEDGRAVWSI